MKHVIVVLALATGFLAYGAGGASAVVCARGIVRAGCVGPNGVVGVRRVVPPRRVMAPTRVVVRRR